MPASGRNSLPFHFACWPPEKEFSKLRIVRESISRDELRDIAQHQFGDMVKAVVDVTRGIMAVGSELHSDDEAILIEDGSRQMDIWGVNIYPDESIDGFLEFDSMINVRPAHGNRSRTVESEEMREKVAGVVRSLVSGS
jgi:hypothetical protein